MLNLEISSAQYNFGASYSQRGYSTRPIASADARKLWQNSVRPTDSLFRFKHGTEIQGTARENPKKLFFLEYSINIIISIMFKKVMDH